MIGTMAIRSLKSVFDDESKKSNIKGIDDEKSFTN